MGVDHNIVLGPYIECVYTPTEGQDTKYTCPKDAGHKPTPAAQFCNQCGSAVVQKTVGTGRFYSPVDSWEVGKEVKERIYCASSMGGHFGAPNTEYWLANINWGGRSTSFDKYEEGVIAIDMELCTKEIDLFQKKFKPELDILQKYYLSVTVRWGLLCYCS